MYFVVAVEPGALGAQSVCYYDLQSRYTLEEVYAANEEFPNLPAWEPVAEFETGREAFLFAADMNRLVRQ